MNRLSTSKADFEALARRHRNSTPVRVERVTHGKVRMNGLVASTDLPRGVIVAVYPVEIIACDDHGDRSASRHYKLALRKSADDWWDDWCGIPTRKTLTMRTRSVVGVDPVAMFVNEPPPNVPSNCSLKFPVVKQPDLTRRRVVYAYLRTTRSIREGETLYICYGPNYGRNYEVNEDCNHKF